MKPPSLQCSRTCSRGSNICITMDTFTGSSQFFHTTSALILDIVFELDQEFIHFSPETSRLGTSCLVVMARSRLQTLGSPPGLPRGEISTGIHYLESLGWRWISVMYMSFSIVWFSERARSWTLMPGPNLDTHSLAHLVGWHRRWWSKWRVMITRLTSGVSASLQSN